MGQPAKDLARQTASSEIDRLPLLAIAGATNPVRTGSRTTKPLIHSCRKEMPLRACRSSSNLTLSYPTRKPVPQCSHCTTYRRPGFVVPIWWKRYSPWRPIVRTGPRSVPLLTALSPPTRGSVFTRKGYSAPGGHGGRRPLGGSVPPRCSPHLTTTTEEVVALLPVEAPRPKG
jgi:hypothetical protein